MLDEADPGAFVNTNRRATTELGARTDAIGSCRLRLAGRDRGSIMRVIDLETWSRRDHFEKFRDFHHPHFDMCADVDVTALRPAVKARGVSFTIAVVYLIGRAANDIPEFRWRIRDGIVVEHEEVHPTATILVDDDLFSFSYFDYCEDFSRFARHAAEEIARVKSEPSLAERGTRDDLLFMTAIPWVSFTSFSHPMPTAPSDSVPRIAWGKLHEREGRTLMPLEVQVNHALMDGIHVGRFFERFQSYAGNPECFLGVG
jgi:chloramphenicol O-acetyltransferase type A